MSVQKSFLLLFAFVMISACNGSDGIGDSQTVPDGTPVQEIFALAEQEVEKERFQNAGDYYLEVERLYPFTPEAARALILAAQAYHDGGALLESRIAAQRYIQFFPGSENADLAYYLVALSYYDGIVDISRDQERTFLALQALQELMDRYPDSEYVEKAKPKYDICLDQLAGKEMEIGKYYQRRGHFTAGIRRYRAVIEEYPENKHTPEAYHRSIESYLALGLRKEAELAFSKFGEATDRDNDWYKRSKQLLETGSQPNAGQSFLRQMLTS